LQIRFAVVGKFPCDKHLALFTNLSHDQEVRQDLRSTSSTGERIALEKFLVFKLELCYTDAVSPKRTRSLGASRSLLHSTKGGWFCMNDVLRVFTTH
jgi:hypothetical protein